MFQVFRFVNNLSSINSKEEKTEDISQPALWTNKLRLNIYVEIKKYICPISVKMWLPL